MQKWPPLGLLVFGPFYLIYKRDYKFSLKALGSFFLFRLFVVGFLHAPVAQAIFIDIHSPMDAFLGLCSMISLTLFVVPAYPDHTYAEMSLWLAYTLLLSLAWMKCDPSSSSASQKGDLKTPLLSALSFLFCDFFVGMLMLESSGSVDGIVSFSGLLFWGVLVLLFGGFPFWLIRRKLKQIPSP